jgi:hypothetical protein
MGRIVLKKSGTPETSAQSRTPFSEANILRKSRFTICSLAKQHPNRLGRQAWLRSFSTLSGAELPLAVRTRSPRLHRGPFRRCEQRLRLSIRLWLADGAQHHLVAFNHHEFLMDAPRSDISARPERTGPWVPLTRSDSRGMENENVAPGPSFGLAHRRPL